MPPEGGSRHELGRGFQQALRVGMFRLFCDVLGRSGLDDLPFVHHRNACREITHDGHGMGDKQVRESEFALQLSEQINDLSPDTDVERRDWLVGYDELWPQRERACDPDSLALASTEFMGEARPGGFVHTDGAKQFGDPAPLSFAGDALVDGKGFSDDVVNSQPRIERAKWILKNDLHFAAHSAEFAVTCDEKIAAIKADGAGRRLDEPEYQAPQRALAGTGFADERERLAHFDRQRDVVNRPHLTMRTSSEDGFAQRINLREIADFDESHAPMVAE